MSSKRVPKADTLKRSEAALRRLGVDALELKRCPEISPMLKRVLGSPWKAIDALRFSPDPSAVQFLEIYDELPAGDIPSLSLEAICIKAQVNPATLLGAALMAAKNVAAQESALEAIVNHPEVLRSTIEFGKTLPGAFMDRKMLHEAVGFLPTPKGVSMNVNLLGGNPQLAASEEDDGDADDEAFRNAFPSINSNLEEWGENRRKLLEKGK